MIAMAGVSRAEPRVKNALQYANPLTTIHDLWPHVYLYDKQRETVMSVWEDDKTFVPAGNMLGKDFVSGLIILTYFLTRHPCRIVTSSIKDEHLVVLWGEIGDFIQKCARPLAISEGGPLIINHRHIRRMWKGELSEKCYIRGMVSEKGEGLQGHHIPDIGDGIPRTLFVGDEASGLDDSCFDVDTWARRMLFIGNCWPCENPFKHAVKGRLGTKDKGGDIPRPSGKGFFRKIIRIKAQDSPNVKYGIQLILAGKREPDPILIRNEEQHWGVYSQEQYERLKERWDNRPAGVENQSAFLVPGVKGFETYLKDRYTMFPEAQVIKLDADWYQGPGSMLYPAEWLDRAEIFADELKASGKKRTSTRYMGIDPAEGGDSSVWVIVDDYGVLYLESKKTPDTSLITSYTLVLMKEYGVEAHNVLFDQGGGGKEHADRLRSQGYKVRTVAFGESASAVTKFRRMRTSKEKEAEKETRYAYKNRRAEMYGLLQQCINPIEGDDGRFAIPAWYPELRRQLAPIPLDWDGEGRLKLPPKNKPSAESNVITMRDLIGCSPDEADALVLAVFGMCVKAPRAVAGAF